MNTRLTAALLTAAAAVFTAWLCTAGSEGPALHRRPADSVRPRASVSPPVESATSDHSGSGSTNEVANGFSLRVTSPRALRASPPASLRVSSPRRDRTAVTDTEVPQSAPVRAPRRGPDRKPVLPLAFREFPDGLYLEPAQTRAVEEVQDQFLAAIGGESADPAAPEYRKKWLNAQRIADLQLRARIGGQAFAAYQRQRSMKENAAAGNGNTAVP